MLDRSGLSKTLLLVLVQMLPATLVAPAIRPLFAALHHGDEGAMHGFMSVNMLAAAVVAPLLAPRLARVRHAGRWLSALTVLDGLLLAACAAPLPVGLVLGLRALEGAAHVTTATVILSEASTRLKRAGRPELMGAVGGAIMAAIAAGSMLGAALLSFSPELPFAVAALLALLSAALLPWALGRLTPADPTASSVRGALTEVRPALFGAFVSRFTIGCLVVSFSLFAHRQHHLTDARVGLLFASLTVPFALFTWPASQLARRFGLARVLAVGAAGWSLSLSSLAWVPAEGLLPVLLVGGLSCACLFAGTLGYAARPVLAAERARSLARFNAAGALGMVLGPPCAGVAAVLAGRGVAGDRAAFFLAAGAMLSWLVIGAPWLRRELREAPQGAPAAPAVA